MCLQLLTETQNIRQPMLLILRSGRCMMRPTNAIASAMSDTPAVVSGTNWEIDP
jgi:hypothetical protein